MPGAEQPERALSRRAALLGLSLGAAAIVSGCARRAPGPSTSATPSPSVAPASPASTTSARPSAKPKPKPGPVQYGSLASKATGRGQSWLICYPPGSTPGDRLPVLIMLHGSGDNISAVEGQGYPASLAAAVKSGTTPFAVAAINGQQSFWQRSKGVDAGALVAREFTAKLASLGLDTSRLALGGWSMGGWGSLRLAGDELRGRLRAVAALSTPCYAKLADAPERGWMSEAAFDANNFFTRPERLAGVPLYLACGQSDAFHPGNLAFADLLSRTPGVETPTLSFGPGDHSHPYWASQAVPLLEFVGRYL